MAGPARNRVKTQVFTVIVILSQSLGNFALSWGMKHRTEALNFTVLAYLQAIFDPWVMIGIALLILWLLSRMALLSWADLSYVLPVTSLGYVITALMGRFFLGEQITWQRWSGTLLIVAGTAVVGLTNPRTTTPLKSCSENSEGTPLPKDRRSVVKDLAPQENL